MEGADCIIALPGGLGTWDELWEMVCLKGIGECPRPTRLSIHKRLLSWSVSRGETVHSDMTWRVGAVHILHPAAMGVKILCLPL